MKVVSPQEFCTLVIDQNWMPQFTITSRACFHHMLKSHGYGLDANKMPYRFDDMRSKTLAVDPRQPVMRSAPNPMTGEETFWFVPTCFVAGPKFYYHKRNEKWSEKNLPSLREVYEHYKHQCQRCLKIIKNMNDASRDHHVPKKLGGGDAVVNITLMCKRCNADLGHQYPKFDINGVEIMPKMVVHKTHFSLPYGAKVWPGWTVHAPWLEHQEGLIHV